MIVGRDWPWRQDQLTEDGTDPAWVAADESGTTGENLLDQQAVVSHATIRIDDRDAAPIVAQLRECAGSLQAPELNFSQFTKDRPLHVLGEVLAPSGPLDGRVNIAVADKRYVAASKIIDLLLEEWAHEHGIDMYRDGSARREARRFFADGPRALGDLWEPLLAAFVSLGRATQRHGVKEDVESFFNRLDQARWRCHRRSVETMLRKLFETRPHAEMLVLSSKRDDVPLPALDPLPAMLPVNITYWYQVYGPFRLLHDEHNLLTPRLVQSLLSGMWHLHPDFVGIIPRTRLAGFAVGKSVDHPSIQLADLAAGAGRVVIEAYQGRGSRQASVLEEAVRPLITWGLLPNDDFWAPR